MDAITDILNNNVMFIIYSLFLVFISWLTTYVITKKRFNPSTKTNEVYIKRSKVLIWFKWLYLYKMVLSSFIVVFQPDLVMIYYKSVVIDAAILLFVDAYHKGTIKKYNERYNARVARGKLKRLQQKQNK